MNPNNQNAAVFTIEWGNGKEPLLKLGTGSNSQNNNNLETKQKVTACIANFTCPPDMATNKDQQNENNALTESTKDI